MSIMRINSRLKNPAGQGLIEMVVVVGMLSIFIVGLIKALTISLKNTQFAKERSMSENYARQAAEWLVFQRDDDWNNLQSRTGMIFCLNDLSDWPLLAGSCGESDFISGTVYQREVALNEIVFNQEIESIVTVSWASPRGGEEFELKLNLTKWR
ncbi:MAG: hypothetical protein JW991_02835 [Candidatus Pacebacteria bacterium]|nr:hypothetical protein [Candidatus Paceibacterota bacterium]